MVGESGVRAIDTRIAGVTVRLADPETLAIVALIVADPVPAAVAVAPLNVATAAFDEAQVTVELMSLDEPSL